MADLLSRRGLFGTASLGVLATTVPALAANSAVSLQPSTNSKTSEVVDLAQADANTVHIIGGPLSGTTLALASDLSEVLDSGSKFRVMPIVGKGSLQNVADLIGMKGIDMAIVQSDVLTFALREHMYPGIAQSIQYITKLYDGEVHVVAHKDIANIQDLAHLKVNCDIVGGGTSITAPLLFDSLGIPIEVTNFDQDLALEKLKRGEIAASVWLVGKPSKLFSSISAQDNLHLLSIKMTPDLLANYSPSQFSHTLYPNLVAEGAVVDTIAVGYVLATYGWKHDSDKYRRLSRFVTAFFDHFEEFKQPPRHPKWQEVNLSADVPGWTRFPPAQEWLNQHAGIAQQSKPLAVDTMTDAEKEQMLRDLQAWKTGNLHKE